MSSFNRLVLATVLVLAMCTDHVAAQDAMRQEGNLRIQGFELPKASDDKLLQYQNTRSASLVDWMPDVGVMISTRFAETAQFHHVNVPLGARNQMTWFEEPVGFGRWVPGTRTLLYTRDEGGNENAQIFRYDRETNTHTLLTDGKSRHGGIVVARRDQLFAFSSNARNGRDTDVYVHRLDSTEAPRLVVSDGGSWGPDDFSTDNSKLLVSTYRSAEDSMAYVLDLGTGEKTPVLDLEPGEKVSVSDAAFHRTVAGELFLVTNRDSEFQRLWRKDAKGRMKCLTEKLDWDVESLALSNDGAHLAFTVNAAGISELYLMGTSGGRYRRLEDREGRVTENALIGGLRFSPDSSRLGMTINRADSPGDVFSFFIKRPRWSRWTRSEVGGLNTETFARPALIEFPSFDGRRITAFYYRPEGTGPFPVVINFHGGPEGQSRPYFSPMYQYLVREMGIAVLDPNVRGSSGFGKSFLALDNAEKRFDSVKDAGALLDWIALQPELDKDRVGVTGGSYGGYMTMAVLAAYPERVRAGVQSVGISNFVTFLENTAEYRRDLRRAEYGDERDPKMRELLQSISPLNQVERIVDPLFSIQGLNDPRVPYTEAEQIVRSLTERGVPAWYLLATDEGHGFGKKRNRDTAMEATMAFWRQFLLDQNEAPTP